MPTVTVTPQKSSYTVGETVTISDSGEGVGESLDAILSDGTTDIVNLSMGAADGGGNASTEMTIPDNPGTGFFFKVFNEDEGVDTLAGFTFSIVEAAATRGPDSVRLSLASKMSIGL